jgi:hypothetical protein
MTIEYRSNRLNVVMNVLNEKTQLIALKEDKLPTPMDSQTQVLTDM